MSVVLVDDLHKVAHPQKRLQHAAKLAGVAGGQDLERIIVRVPDRQTNGLHALGVQDVTEMLREHGRIVDINVTENGTIVGAADVCRRRGHAVVWTGQAIGPWHPGDIIRRGLGGSETAAVRVAEHLSRMGWIVTLYGDFEAPGLAGDVMLRRFDRYDPSEPIDVLIGLRYAPLFEERPNAEFTVLWLEDLAPRQHLTPQRLANIDRVCGVSHWHHDQILREHPWINGADRNKVKACRNGIVNDWFTSDPTPDRQLRAVYSSSPDRGGDIVLELWPRVREQVPDAELILTYPRWFDLCAQQFRMAQEHLARIHELLEQPGVSRVEGGLGQRQLATLMRSSMVWVHPSYYTPAGQKFEETSCISCMEAQAAGLAVVCADWGRLSENVLYGTKLAGDPTSEEWRDRFVDAIVKGLTDETVQAAAQECGPEMMSGMGWEGAVEQLAAMFPARSRDRMLANL